MEYVKPEIQVVEFTTESIATTGTIYGSGGTWGGD